MNRTCIKNVLWLYKGEKEKVEHTSVKKTKTNYYALFPTLI